MYGKSCHIRDQLEIKNILTRKKKTTVKMEISTEKFAQYTKMVYYKKVDFCNILALAKQKVGHSIKTIF